MIACTLAPRGGSAVLINLEGARPGFEIEWRVEGRLVSRVPVYHDHVVGTSAMEAVALLDAKPAP
jgi:malic enzyme